VKGVMSDPGLVLVDASLNLIASKCGGDQCQFVFQRNRCEEKVHPFRHRRLHSVRVRGTLDRRDSNGGAADGCLLGVGTPATVLVTVTRGVVVSNSGSARHSPFTSVE